MEEYFDHLNYSKLMGGEVVLDKSKKITKSALEDKALISMKYSHNWLDDKSIENIVFFAERMSWEDLGDLKYREEWEDTISLFDNVTASLKNRQAIPAKVLRKLVYMIKTEKQNTVCIELIQKIFCDLEQRNCCREDFGKILLCILEQDNKEILTKELVEKVTYIIDLKNGNNISDELFDKIIFTTELEHQMPLPNFVFEIVALKFPELEVQNQNNVFEEVKKEILSILKIEKQDIISRKMINKMIDKIICILPHYKFEKNNLDEDYLDHVLKRTDCLSVESLDLESNNELVLQAAFCDPHDSEENKLHRLACRQPAILYNLIKEMYILKTENNNIIANELYEQIIYLLKLKNSNLISSKLNEKLSLVSMEALANFAVSKCEKLIPIKLKELFILDEIKRFEFSFYKDLINYMLLSAKIKYVHEEAHSNKDFSNIITDFKKFGKNHALTDTYIYSEDSDIYHKITNFLNKTLLSNPSNKLPRYMEDFVFLQDISLFGD